MGIRPIDYFRLAFKDLVNQQARSVLAALAIIIGATSITLMLALIMSARNFYYDQFKSTGQLSQIIVTQQPGLDFEQAQQPGSCANCLKLTNQLAKQIAAYQHVSALSPTANLNVFEAATVDGHKQPVSGAVGYQPDGVIEHNFLAGGNFTPAGSPQQIIIGQTYADQWGYRGRYQALIGRPISLLTTSSYTGEGAKLPDPTAQFKLCQTTCQASDFSSQQASSLTATIVGVESDQSRGLFVPLSWANGLLQDQHYEITPANQAAYTEAYTVWNADGRYGAEPLPQFTLASDNVLTDNGYSTFVVKVDDPRNADSLAARIQKLGVGAATGKAYVKDQLKVFDIVSYILAGIGGIALVVAAIGIVNTMVMAVLERTRDIGVMRAVGASRSTVGRLFTLEASLLGFLGGVSGVILGFGLTRLADVIINHQLAQNAVTAHNIVGLPVYVALIVVGATTLLGMLAGLYPAQRAARLDPVEALRRE